MYSNSQHSTHSSVMSIWLNQVWYQKQNYWQIECFYSCFLLLSSHTHTHTHFTVLYILSQTTSVSWYQKVHFTILSVFWCKMKITQADTRTIQMNFHLIQPNWCPHLCYAHNFYAGCASWHNRPNLSWFGTGTKYAGLHIAYCRLGYIAACQRDNCIWSVKLFYFSMAGHWLSVVNEALFHMGLAAVSFSLYYSFNKTFWHCILYICLFFDFCFFMMPEIKIYQVQICCKKKLGLIMKRIEHADHDN